MIKNEKKHIFMDIIKEALSFIPSILSAIIFPHITKGAEIIMRDIEDKMVQTEKRIIRNMSALLIIGFGGVFLIFALFFFLKEYLGWNNTITFFSIGITIFVIGLLLKLGQTNKLKN